jgi:hypothetical protein
MRSTLPLVLSCLILGCFHTQKSSQTTIAPPRKPLLADRDNVAQHLPKDLKLSTVVDDAPGGGHPFTLEAALVNAGTRVSPDGKLIAADGKVIYFQHYMPHGAQLLESDAERQEKLKLEEQYHVIHINDAPGQIFC